jgi:predicted P-loop ATPase
MSKQEAAIKYITENYLDYSRLRHDVIADKLQVRMENGWREMTKHDINSIVCHAAQEYDANITSREVMTALQSDLIPDVHPLREYVLSCREWTEEQPDWIDWVASQVHVVDANADRLWRGCFKKWFVAMVASWMKDEVVNHQVLVLIGKQGIFKTTWLEHLIPPHLRAYACKLANSNDLNKDERLRIAEFGLISLDEIDSMNNRELNQLKSVITATDVNERAAYAYTKERRVRLASFCASGNRRDFLTDITGNRRWLPFEVESIQNPFYAIMPYEQMYAQAWTLAQDPLFSYWFDLDEIEVLEKHNQHFRDESNEEQLLDVYFAVPAEGASNTKFLTTAEISERLIYYGNIKRPLSLSRLGVLLSQKGFLSIRKGSPQRRGWIVYERDNEEINAERRILSKT